MLSSDNVIRLVSNGKVWDGSKDMQVTNGFSSGDIIVFKVD
jgi:hypothetical protein